MDNIFVKQPTSKLTHLISIMALLVFMPLLLFGTSEVIQLVSKASGTPANIVINTKLQLEPLDLSFYHAFAQGGEEANDMLKPVLAEVKALKPQYIRIDHIYDHYDVVAKNGAQLSFNWSKLDAAVDTILATGAKPVLALSYMPAAIAKDGVIINVPNDWNDWAAVVEHTIEHYSGKSGKNISGIYYEVWNEPDLAQFGNWKYGGEKSYITLYQYASTGAKQVQNAQAFYLGGPGTTGLYQSWINALANSGARIDFISWHTYQWDPSKYDTDQQNLAQWLLPYPRLTLVPKLITEFGPTGDKSQVYNTTFSAAYVAAVSAQLLSNGVSYIFSFQPKDGPGQESGNGWGLLTHEANGKKPKPRYWIYSFLDDMAGRRISLKGEGTWVTGFASVRDQTTRVLLVNYDTAGTHTETVPVTFGNLTPGTYSYRQQFFLGQDVTLTETVEGDTLQKKILMPPSSVLMLEITKK